MAIWEDATGYSQGDKVRKPTTWDLRTKHLRITVHQYRGCGDAWFLTCHDLRIDKYDLGTTDVAVARRKALNRVLSHTKSIAAEVAALCEGAS